MPDIAACYPGQPLSIQAALGDLTGPPEPLSWPQHLQDLHFQGDPFALGFVPPWGCYGGCRVWASLGIQSSSSLSLQLLSSLVH